MLPPGVVLCYHNLLRPPRWEASRQARPHRDLHSVGIHTRERGLMNPATNKYPRPILALLCKRFKQRNERHLVRIWCRLKILATATLKKFILLNCGGNHKILDWLLFWEPPTGATPQGVLPPK